MVSELHRSLVDARGDAIVHRASNARAARERALVLNAVGIPSRVHQEGAEHLVVVHPAHAEAAQGQLADYAEENRDWPPRYAAPPLRSRGRIGAALWVLVLLAIFPMGQRGFLGVNLWDPGMLRVGELWRGQWWRLFTPLTLHGDLSHLAGNLVSGVAFGILCAHQLGGGLAWLAIVLAGGLGNLLGALVKSPGHGSIGASTAVFGAIGLLASYEWLRRHTLRHPPMRRLAPLAGGLVLLGYLGTSGERTDIAAHLGGFLAGLLLGAAIAALDLPARLSPRAQLLAGLLAPLLVAAAWTAALAG